MLRLLAVRPAALLALTAGGAWFADGPGPLRVLQATPNGPASPVATITVMFDRPVAGSLDRTVDPRKLLRLEPAVPGVTDWRDPVTLRFRPAAPLVPGTTYHVRVSDDFAAMDGARLAQPYEFDVRVRGPRLLAGLPAGPGQDPPRFLTPDATFDLVLDAPADLAAVARAAYVEFDATCAEPGPVRLRATGQRAIADDDPWQFREAGGWERDRATDSLRRVVHLVPERKLPRACRGALRVPEAIGDGGAPQRFALETYGPFTLAKARCGWGASCPTGPIVLEFSTPVKGADVLRHVQVSPALQPVVDDTAEVRASWSLDGPFKPRTRYAVRVAPDLRDDFGQPVGGTLAAEVTTTGYPPAVDYLSGRATVERNGFGTLAVTYVNVDTLDVLLAAVPESLEARVLGSGWNTEEWWNPLRRTARVRRQAVGAPLDQPRVFGVKLPVAAARTPGTPTLWAVEVSSPRLDSLSRRRRPVAVVQVTDLGVHAKVGADEAAVWVTGVGDGRPRGGVAVALHDATGRVLARGVTDTAGLVRLGGWTVPADTSEERRYSPIEGYVEASQGADRALVAINQYDPDLSPWRFNARPGWDQERLPAAAALFSERGIYRPGETVRLKAIARRGTLGSLQPVARGDTLRWTVRDREGAAVREVLATASVFGTADLAVKVPAGAKLGDWDAALELRRRGRWVPLARTAFRIAEYRPPEFLVDVLTASAPGVAGDTLRATIEGRYLFGAPMARASVAWTARQVPLDPWEIEVPGAEGWTLGETGAWYEEFEDRATPVRTLVALADSLDAQGRLTVAVAVPGDSGARPVRATVEATVSDVNRQRVSGSTTVTVHPAAFYLGLRPQGNGWFWQAGTPVTVDVAAFATGGGMVPGVAVTGTVVRREWHSVRRERGGYGELVGEWVSDTVAACRLVTAQAPVPCRFTPAAGGTYTIAVAARDARGRAVRSSLLRWVVGKDWVPWNDESQFKMDVIPDRTRYAPGDTATILLAAPFTGADAWLTVEREGLIEQRRLRITSGTTTIRLPITEAHAPNVFVSVLTARGRSAPPGPLDDPGRPTLRVGYAELRVTPEVKRLAVQVEPARAEYRPGDTAQVRVRVRNAAGRGERAEVTLWAVDEGVLALTGYRTPDPLDLLYRPRGLGLRLGSDLTSVAPQVPEGEKGRRAPGGGGGGENLDVLRSRFQTTAFFLASVLTDLNGDAVARAKLPDNLTTFRVMAVAVTAGDRYGSGDARLLVTRPLLARPALPRFVRPTDEFSAGAVINTRSGGTPRVAVTAQGTGIALLGDSAKSATLAAGKGREVRFDWRARAGDSATFRIDVAGGADRDAVRLSVPVRPLFRERAVTVAGTVTDTATLALTLPAGYDLPASRLTLNLGTSPLAAIRGIAKNLRVYPYACSEQLASQLLPLLALLRADATLGAGTVAGSGLRAEAQRAVDVLQSRQRDDGGIGLWGVEGWTTPWLSAYAGGALLEAKAAGLRVSDSVVARLGGYLQRTTTDVRLTPLAAWYADPTVVLSDRVGVLAYLSRAGVRNRALENELLRLAPQLAWEDRVRLGAVFARYRDLVTAKRLLATAWSGVTVQGRAAVLPASSRRAFYFASEVRPAALLLEATLAVDPAHPLVAPLVETVLAGARAALPWTTQDYAWAAVALARVEALRRGAAGRTLEVASGGRTLWRTTLGDAAPADSTIPLAGLGLARGDSVVVPLRVSVSPGQGPAFVFVTASLVPKGAPVRPVDQGILVERWYETYEDGKPVTTVAAGQLVRVRLRVTVPADRNFVVLDDPLPAGLEAVDLSLRLTGGFADLGAAGAARTEGEDEEGGAAGAPSLRWAYGSWDAGWWSPFDHRELRDDRVVWFATVLWKGSYTATYVARATSPGRFARPPAHAEEMYDPAVQGESDGGTFTVLAPKER